MLVALAVALMLFSTLIEVSVVVECCRMSATRWRQCRGVRISLRKLLEWRVYTMRSEYQLVSGTTAYHLGKLLLSTSRDFELPQGVRIDRRI